MKSVLACVMAIAFLAVPACGQSVFSIGNSLTWDAVPAWLEGDVGWHITCNKNLHHIYSHPESFCVGSSTPWTEALSSESFDFVTVQPFTGTTLSKDAEIISVWMHQQPESQFILHTGWSSVNALVTNYELPNLDDQMRHSAAYFNDLLAALSHNYPEREVVSSHAVDLLYVIAKDIEQGIGPFDDFDELFRDSIHLDTGEGRYLVHNAMRHALGQPFTNEGFDVAPEVADYLNYKIENIEDIVGALFGPGREPGDRPVDSSGGLSTSLETASTAAATDAVLGVMPTGVSTSAVPEPTSAALILAASALMVIRRRQLA